MLTGIGKGSHPFLRLLSAPPPSQEGVGSPNSSAFFSEGGRFLGESGVLVVAGFDHIENVLRKFDIPNKVVKSTQVTDRLLSGAEYLFVNCGGSFSKESFIPQRIAEWVEGGGGY